MIGDIVKRSLCSPKVLIPVEELLGDATGSRLPEVRPERLNSAAAQKAVDACPTTALALEPGERGLTLAMNYAECIGCGYCREAGDGAFVLAQKLTRCGLDKPSLIRRWDIDTTEELDSAEPDPIATSQEIRELFGRALNIREVDAGSCNACEGEIIALNNPYYDLERFGIHFVASPKHADMLLVTGPVTRNMADALKNTYEATPSPKLVVAAGTCACSGGIFAGSHAVVGAVDALIPVDGYIPGCPPTPAMLLSGILAVLRGRK